MDPPKIQEEKFNYLWHLYSVRCTPSPGRCGLSPVLCTLYPALGALCRGYGQGPVRDSPGSAVHPCDASMPQTQGALVLEVVRRQPPPPVPHGCDGTPRSRGRRVDPADFGRISALPAGQLPVV